MGSVCGPKFKVEKVAVLRQPVRSWFCYVWNKQGSVACRAGSVVCGVHKVPLRAELVLFCVE